ncbi:hypothetical protein PHMEG_0003122 [Phytophthora megakarya]|uniref:Uncharacterized protein n=1 Tax=Phytophthora megakarya TaxID=4795 RepID=A0A225WYV1_9STRA|nr:hypothetical protein PHMEG_0003122 [Phytophthora megakarya]
MGPSGLPHLAVSEWGSLQHLSTSIGEAVGATILRSLSSTEEHGVALRFIMSEQVEIVAAKLSPGETPQNTWAEKARSCSAGLSNLTQSLRIVVSSTHWRKLPSPGFAWCTREVLGLRGRLTDPTWYNTYQTFKGELKLAFKSPRMSSGREWNFSICGR